MSKPRNGGQANQVSSYSIIDPGYVVLNSGCPVKDVYFAISDMVVVFEHDYFAFTSPPLNHPAYEHLTKVGRNHGRKVMLPQFSTAAPASKYAVMIHDFLPRGEQKTQLEELGVVVHDLVRVKRVGAVFVTDIEIEKADVYANWSSFWTEFIRMVAEEGTATNLW